MAKQKFKWPKSPWFWIFIGWWLVPVLLVFVLMYKCGQWLYDGILKLYNRNKAPDQQIQGGGGKRIAIGVVSLVLGLSACGALIGDEETAENMIETAESQVEVYEEATDELLEKLPDVSEEASGEASEPVPVPVPVVKPSELEPVPESEPVSEPAEESTPEPVEPSEPAEPSEAASSEVAVEALSFVSCPTTVYQGSDATVKVKGTPGTQYSITVEYKSGPSKAKGLDPKTADANGNVSWTWSIGMNTSTKFQPVVTVSGGGESISQKITVSE